MALKDIFVQVSGLNQSLSPTNTSSSKVANIPCFAPSKETAQIEGSKAFSKDFMARHKILTAEYRNFRSFSAAEAYIKSISHKVVLKASGLAAGKGVILPETKDEALQGLREIMLDHKFGNAGDEVVIEELLEGDELSILTFSDGKTFKSMSPAQDHKRIFDGDLGPNTGGMGCYAPTKIATPEVIREIKETILRPTFEGLRKEGNIFILPYRKFGVGTKIYAQASRLLACSSQASC
jgi:phosphoribosylamine--glycine ligase/phosphoribosylformylglycinamidine cyclo-ligase